MLPYYIRSLIPSRPLSLLPIRSVLPPRTRSELTVSLQFLLILLLLPPAFSLLLSGAIAGTLVRKIAGSSHGVGRKEGTCRRSITRRPCHLSRVLRPACPPSGWLTLYVGRKAGRPSDCLCIAGYKCVPEEFASVRAMGGRWDVLSHEATVGARQPVQIRGRSWAQCTRQCSHCLTLSLVMQVMLLMK